MNDATDFHPNRWSSDFGDLGGSIRGRGPGWTYFREGEIRPGLPDTGVLGVGG